MQTNDKYRAIDDYGLIGNLHTSALVSKEGSIDYLPFPRYDSPTIFGALFDSEKGGFFSIQSKENEVNFKQLYLPDTAILLTRFLTSHGIAEITDFMPPIQMAKRMILIRKLRVIKGELSFRVIIHPRFDYGKNGFSLEKKGESIVVNSDGNNDAAFLLNSEAEFEHIEGKLVADIHLKAGEENSFLLSEPTAENKDELPKEIQNIADRHFKDTIKYWRKWTSICKYNGRWKNMVNRSAITLKLLTSAQFGSTVAAATFGLPEHIGGARNWDYRYSWIRDSSFTMYTFLQLGFHEEAKQFIRWIENRIQETDSADDLKLMYRIDGNSDLEEKELSWLDGYKNSRPVRIGNGAYKQFQLDIYGELIDTIFIYNKNAEPITYQLWTGLVKFIDFVSENWKKKDRGMWEVRSETKEFLISKVMSWVALDRGILIAEDRSFPAPLERWHKVRDEIYTDVFENYWNEEIQSFVQYRGTNSIDATALLIPMVRMLSPKEPKWLATLHKIEQELLTDSLVYRYQTGQAADEGFKEIEGTFSMCSFWYIECLAKIGESDKAILHFEKMLGYANHLGLFSEQISPKGELLGNFPQAFTHLGLISTAIKLKLLSEGGSLLKQQKK